MSGWHYITSTSWDNWNEEICRDVMHGYMTTGNPRILPVWCRKYRCGCILRLCTEIKGQKAATICPG